MSADTAVPAFATRSSAIAPKSFAPASTGASFTAVTSTRIW